LTTAGVILSKKMMENPAEYLK